MSDSVEQERQHRQKLWRQLIAAGGPLDVSPPILRSLGIYGGAQGIWVEKVRTSSLTPDGIGVTVSVLHTGSSYPDDLSEDGMLYHYPLTKRPEARDRSEIESTKAAGKLHLPLFVITYPTVKSNKRDVHLGWVAGWDDQCREFLITFGEKPVQVLSEENEEKEPFVLKSRQAGTVREVEQRKGQTVFKFNVLKRYGPRCAVCDVAVVAVLDAAHLCPKNKGGTDDPRNGLILCATHHRAFDANFFAIEPQTHKIQCKVQTPHSQTLRITKTTLGHLLKKPHRVAIEWRWKKWIKIKDGTSANG